MMKRIRIEIARGLIKDFGGPTNLGNAVGLGQSAISNWAQRGAPRGWILFLQQKFPNLPTWQKFPEVSNDVSNS